jgi:Skp family chaperone for outer membrane proteins
MKKMTMLMLAAVSIGFSACAQKMKEADVPAAVRTAFTKQYPAIPAKWEKENGQYEVNFTKDGASMSALYDANGSLKETETDIKVATLPEAVLTYVKEHYKGKTIKESARITKADGTVNYEAEVGGMDVIFDASGKYIREAKD